MCDAQILQRAQCSRIDVVELSASICGDRSVDLICYVRVPEVPDDQLVDDWLRWLCISLSQDSRQIQGQSARKDWRNNLELILILALTLVWCSRLSPGSPYRKEIKAVDRMSETPKQAFTKSIGTVSILLKAGDLLLFGSSSCTKSNSRPLVGEQQQPGGQAAFRFTAVA